MKKLSLSLFIFSLSLIVMGAPVISKAAPPDGVESPEWLGDLQQQVEPAEPQWMNTEEVDTRVGVVAEPQWIAADPVPLSPKPALPKIDADNPPQWFKDPPPKCGSLFENFDRSGVSSNYGDSIEFKWNGPGCSDYKWSHYALCFKNSHNANEKACLGIPHSNHWTLTEGDWEFIDSEMQTPIHSKHVNSQWHVESYFGDAKLGEVLGTTPWDFTYSR